VPVSLTILARHLGHRAAGGRDTYPFLAHRLDVWVAAPASRC